MATATDQARSSFHPISISFGILGIRLPVSETEARKFSFARTVFAILMTAIAIMGEVGAVYECLTIRFDIIKVYTDMLDVLIPITLRFVLIFKRYSIAAAIDSISTAPTCTTKKLKTSRKVTMNVFLSLSFILPILFASNDATSGIFVYEPVIWFIFARLKTIIDVTTACLCFILVINYYALTRDLTFNLSKIFENRCYLDIVRDHVQFYKGIKDAKNAVQQSVSILVTLLLCYAFNKMCFVVIFTIRPFIFKSLGLGLDSVLAVGMTLGLFCLCYTAGDMKKCAQKTKEIVKSKDISKEDVNTYPNARLLVSNSGNENSYLTFGVAKVIAKSEGSSKTNTVDISCIVNEGDIPGPKRVANFNDNASGMTLLQSSTNDFAADMHFTALGLVRIEIGLFLAMLCVYALLVSYGKTGILYVERIMHV